MHSLLILRSVLEILSISFRPIFQLRFQMRRRCKGFFYFSFIISNNRIVVSFCRYFEFYLKSLFALENQAFQFLFLSNVKKFPYSKFLQTLDFTGFYRYFADKSILPNRLRKPWFYELFAYSNSVAKKGIFLPRFWPLISFKIVRSGVIFRPLMWTLFR